MPELLSLPTLIAVATVLLAGIVRGFAGFGSAMIMVPVLAVLYGPVPAVAMAMLLEMAVSMPLVPKAMKLVDWGRIAPLTVAAYLAIPLGIWALRSVDAAIARYVFSAIIIGAVILLAIGWRYQGRPGILPTLFTGVLSGVMNGFAGMAGPPVVFFYLAGNSGAAASRASFIIFFAVVDLVSLIGFAILGVYDAPMLLLTALIAVPFVLGGLIGAKMFGRSGERFYRLVALAILAAIALGTLLV